MVVIIVPEKKKALARSHWLAKLEALLLGSTPAPMASATSWDQMVEKRNKGLRPRDGQTMVPHGVRRVMKPASNSIFHLIQTE